eukprot:GFUD01036148.1.p1 GENE.GFUD01036148.1~~GFUD01036148.1.p1  ORF type:complete len:120 (-),score=23.34 GFUD01036148.1:23-382(-)
MSRFHSPLLMSLNLVILFPLFLCSMNPMMRTLRMSPTDELCDGTLDLKTYLFMNRMCEDCFSLYRDSDIYSACRSGCFGSSYFQGCMQSLMVDKDTQGRAVGYLRARFGHSEFGFDPLA